MFQGKPFICSQAHGHRQGTTVAHFQRLHVLFHTKAILLCSSHPIVLCKFYYKYGHFLV